MSDTSDDDFLEAEVESGLAPLRAMGLSQAQIAEAASLLRMALVDHATGRYLMNRARPRTVTASGTTVVEGVDGVASRPSAKARSSR